MRGGNSLRYGKKKKINAKGLRLSVNDRAGKKQVGDDLAAWKSAEHKATFFPRLAQANLFLTPQTTDSFLSHLSSRMLFMLFYH